MKSYCYAFKLEFQTWQTANDTNETSCNGMARTKMPKCAAQYFVVISITKSITNYLFNGQSEEQRKWNQNHAGNQRNCRELLADWRVLQAADITLARMHDRLYDICKIDRYVQVYLQACTLTTTDTLAHANLAKVAKFGSEFTKLSNVRASSSKKALPKIEECKNNYELVDDKSRFCGRTIKLLATLLAVHENQNAIAWM